MNVIIQTVEWSSFIANYFTNFYSKKSLVWRNYYVKLYYDHTHGIAWRDSNSSSYSWNSSSYHLEIL